MLKRGLSGTSSEVAGRQRLKLEDLKWFDIDAYSEVKNWSLNQWRGSLLLRLHFFREMAWQPLDEAYLKHIDEFLLSPAVMRNIHHRELGAGNNRPRVVDRDVVEWVTDNEIFDEPQMADIKAGLALWPQKEEIAEVLSGSFEQVYRDRTGRSLPHQVLAVDLDATDEQLISDFKEWLKAKRASISSNIPQRNFTERDVSEWSRYGVLPYLDLRLFASSRGASISNATIGNLLFPRESDIDFAERVRKVVKPMAESLMSYDVLEAIDAQIAQAERN